MATREVRQESSIPVAGRVSTITLAELDMYWGAKGYTVRNMGQLLSWSIQMFREVLVSNSLLPMEIATVAESHTYLEERNLYQPSLKKRSMKKIANAITIENLRHEGIDPETVVGPQYRTVHNKHSVTEIEEQPISEKTKEAMKIYHGLYGEEGASDAEVEAQRREALDKSLEESRKLGKIAVVKEEGKSSAAELDQLEQQGAARDAERAQLEKDAKPDMSKAITLDKEDKDG